ncbi:MAG: helix-turn-helix domain-containing protein [Chloroflexota bacterium]
MTSVVDLWRALDPDARLLAGSDAALRSAVRGVHRTRAAPPHLPPPTDGALLVADAALVVGTSLDGLLAAIGEAGLAPPAILLGGVTRSLEAPGGDVPVIASVLLAARLADAGLAYLTDERGHLARLAVSIRLAAAEAALADPSLGAAAGAVAARLRRGVAVAVDGKLLALNPRAAGRALAARFAAVHARLLADASGTEAQRRLRDGLWVLHQPIRERAALWLFDDVPFARVDAAAAEALAVTIRALLRRPAPSATARADAPAPPQPPRTDDPLGATLLAVARANGRIAPAARALGVHRNTVLYRLRIAHGERGLDPRRPDDALRILRAAERSE